VIRLALLLVVGFAILSLCGGRSATGFLSGTGGTVSLLGSLYALAWFGCVIAAPILCLASLFSMAYGRIVRWTATRRP